MKDFLNSILYSWELDTPSEVFWSLDDLLKWAKSKGFESDLSFIDSIDFNDQKEQEEIGSNNKELIEQLVEFFDKLKLE